MRDNFLLSPDFAVFTTRAYALASGQLLPGASRSLKRLAARGIIRRITKGVWANTRHPYFTPFGAVPLLLGTEQGYVSFLTALHSHGALSQIPTTIQIATTGHGRKLKTPIGTYEFFQLKPGVMLEGVEWSGAHLPYRIATREKALIDTLYISTRRGRRFSSLPELEPDFDRKKVKRLLTSQVKLDRIRIAMTRRLGELGIFFPKK